MIKDLKKLLYNKLKAFYKKEMDNARLQANILTKLMTARLDIEIKKILEKDGVEGLNILEFPFLPNEYIVSFDIPTDIRFTESEFKKDKLMLRYLSENLSKIYGVEVTFRYKDGIILAHFRSVYNFKGGE
jgi:hypothetical protein